MVVVVGGVVGVVVVVGSDSGGSVGSVVVDPTWSSPAVVGVTVGGTVVGAEATGWYRPAETVTAVPAGATVVVGRAWWRARSVVWSACSFEVRASTSAWSLAASAEVAATGDAVDNGAAEAVATPATIPPVASAAITIFFAVFGMTYPFDLSVGSLPAPSYE